MSQQTERQKRLNDKFSGKYVTYNGRFVGIVRDIKVAYVSNESAYSISLHDAPVFTTRNTKRLKTITADEVRDKYKFQRQTPN